MAERTTSSITIEAAPADRHGGDRRLRPLPGWTGEVKEARGPLARTPTGRAERSASSWTRARSRTTYTLGYTWQATTRSAGPWSRPQDAPRRSTARYRLADAGNGTEVTYQLTVDVKIPMIGMIKRKAEKVIIDRALAGLKKRVRPQEAGRRARTLGLRRSGRGCGRPGGRVSEFCCSRARAASARRPPRRPPPRSRPGPGSRRWWSPPTPRTRWPTRSASSVGASPPRSRPASTCTRSTPRRRWSASGASCATTPGAFLAELGLDEVTSEEITVLPGAEEIIALLELREQARTGRWDVIVVDCAPTAETLRLLALPEALDWHMNRLLPVGARLMRALAPVDPPRRQVSVPGRRGRRGGAAPPRPAGGARAAHRARRLACAWCSPRGRRARRGPAHAHLPQPVRLPRRRGDRQPGLPAEGADAWRPSGWRPSPGTWPRSRSPSRRCPSTSCPTWPPSPSARTPSPGWPRRMYGEADPLRPAHGGPAAADHRRGRADPGPAARRHGRGATWRARATS